MEISENYNLDLCKGIIFSNKNPDFLLWDIGELLALKLYLISKFPLKQDFPKKNPKEHNGIQDCNEIFARIQRKLFSSYRSLPIQWKNFGDPASQAA